MTDRVLSTRQLNRALLARQLLLERSSLPLPGALEAVGGLQTQYAPSGYVGLWSRLRDFRREALTKALMNRDAIQGTLMRSTIHMDVVAGTVRERLSHGPARAAELKALLAANGIPAIAWSGLGLWLEMIRVPPSGTWDRRQADLYGLADDWVGAIAASEEAGMELLVRRYLGGFGPAKLADIASWAGLAPAKVIPAVERMRLRRFRDEHDKVLFDLPRAPLPDAGVRAPVRFLQTFEAMLMIHARRTQIMPEQFRPIVFNIKTPHSMPVFLIDGAVAGTWRYEGGQIVTRPFEPIPRSVRDELDEEAKALAAFHAD